MASCAAPRCAKVRCTVGPARPLPNPRAPPPAPLPACSPWHGPEYEGLLVERSRKGHLTLNGFLANWAYTTLLDPTKTLEYALYLG